MYIYVYHYLCILEQCDIQCRNKGHIREMYDMLQTHFPSFKYVFECRVTNVYLCVCIYEYMCVCLCLV